MPCFIIRDGWPTEVEWPEGDGLPVRDEGSPVFATLRGAVRSAGVPATVFERPVRAETLYDGPRFFADGAMVPVGTKAVYCVDMFGKDKS